MLIQHFQRTMGVGLLLVHWKSLLDFVVQPKMPEKALENHQKNTVVKKQKNMHSAYPQSLKSAQRSSGSVNTSYFNVFPYF